MVRFKHLTAVFLFVLVVPPTNTDDVITRNVRLIQGYLILVTDPKILGAPLEIGQNLTQIYNCAHIVFVFRTVQFGIVIITALQARAAVHNVRLLTLIQGLQTKLQ